MTNYQYKEYRQQYINNPIQIIYMYYCDESGENVDPPFFVTAFENWILNHTDSMSMKDAQARIISMLDKKFNVTLVKDKKTNKILKIV